MAIGMTLLEETTFQRAGDGTRTRDVQLEPPDIPGMPAVPPALSLRVGPCGPAPGLAAGSADAALLALSLERHAASAATPAGVAVPKAEGA
jgi:hypothetical protein